MFSDKAWLGSALWYGAVHLLTLNPILEQDAQDLVCAVFTDHRPDACVDESPILSQVVAISLQPRDHSCEFTTSAESEKVGLC